MSSETGDADGVSSQRDNDDVLRHRIRSLIRTARQERGLTQADVGKQVGASRFSINRIEAGVTDLTPPLAEQLEQVLGLTELRSLVAQRNRLVIPTNLGRDAVVARLLDDPQLRRLRIVLVDNLDLYPMLYTWAKGDSVLRGEDIEVVVPTRRRERELFGRDSGLRRTIDYQIKRILDLRKSDHYAADSLRLYESDDVTSAVVVAVRGDRAEGVIWPPIVASGRWTPAQAAALPVGVTVDQHAVAQLDAHIDLLIAGREPLRSNEALCRVEKPDEGAPLSDVASKFTRYFTVGEDQEEDVDDSEGIAVALILVVALCPRRRYGVGRRTVTFMRASSRQDHVRRRSLFSNTVEHIDIRRARAEKTGQPVDEQLSTQSALAAAIEIDDYLESKDKIIPDLAYQIAAAREMAMYGLDISPDRFEPAALPSGLWLIEKSDTNGRKRASIAPRLFVLELSTQPTPELVTLQTNAYVEEVGAQDVLEESDLNSFLGAARENGFLTELLAQNRIVDR
jgi:DNA-binding XRE family transcriptional regulator